MFLRKAKSKAGKGGGRTTVYGIAGACHAVGTTHLAIMTANYLSSAEGMRTALLEWNESGTFGRTAKVRGFPEPARKFEIMGVRCVSGAGVAELLLSEEEGNSAVVIDFGVLGAANRDEFLRCDRRWIIGGMSDWQIDAAANAADGMRGRGEITFFCTFGAEEARRLFERWMGIRVIRIPWSDEAWKMDGRVLAFFSRLIRTG